MLDLPFNPAGAFLIRYSNRKQKFILSVKVYKEAKNKFKYSHFEIHKQKDRERYYITATSDFSSLQDLLDHYVSEGGITNLVSLSIPCIVPYPFSDAQHFSSLNSVKHYDPWQIPRTELKLGNELGHGYFGTVFKASWNNQLDVAVKTFREYRLADANYDRNREIFIREIDIMKKLNHPYVIKLLGVCTETFPYYLVQELCFNGDMMHYLRKFSYLKFSPDPARSKKDGTPSFNDLVIWVAQVLQGMVYFEKLGLIHRDLAARNILLNQHFEAKIADFGLTLIADRLDDSGYDDYEEDTAEDNSDDKKQLAGEGDKPIIAVYWSAPEVLEQREFSHKSDVWAFGITMWEILSLADRPYNGMHKAELKKKIREEIYHMDPPKNYLHAPKAVFDPLYQVIKKCWERHPSDRPNFVKLYEMVTNILKTMRSRRENTLSQKRNAWENTFGENSPEATAMNWLKPVVNGAKRRSSVSSSSRSSPSRRRRLSDIIPGGAHHTDSKTLIESLGAFRLLPSDSKL